MNAFHVALLLVGTLFPISPVWAQIETESRAAPDANVLDAEEWKQIDASVERGLAWLATQQQDDGSFETLDLGQPAVTAFCVMAFLAQGESPIDGKYQDQLIRAVDFIAAQQKTNGLIALNAPDQIPIPRNVHHKSIGIHTVYNHAISALALAEVYGQCTPEQTKKLAPILEKAIATTLKMQSWKRRKERDVGGWRYLDLSQSTGDSDLSVTGWQLMFLRSAQSAGLDVPKANIDAAVKYIENCFLKDEDRRVHSYLAGNTSTCTRAMAGAGVLALAHAGQHGSKEAIASGEWILAHDFSNYNDDKPEYGPWPVDRYHYGAVLCTQAMYQLGGKYWKRFFPPLVETLLANQNKSGSWAPERREHQYGSCYSTSLCILSLSVPNQMLPIFQR